jgi:hypothetical protein
MKQEQIVEGLKKCPHFNSCNQNLCPLDLELELRAGKNGEECRWMREPITKKINGKEFISGGSLMPDALLNFVPAGNIERLNQSSQNRLKKLNKK